MSNPRGSGIKDQKLPTVKSEGNGKGKTEDNGWKGVAYTTAANILSAQFAIQITADNIKNRVKSWKKYYGVVSDILSQSGFSWDFLTQMINVDENRVWEEYVKVQNLYELFFSHYCLSILLKFSYTTLICLQSHNDAVSFRYKRIPNWDDIVDLCGKDRATGEGAETGFEATEVMTPPASEHNHVDLENDDQVFGDIHIIDDNSPDQAIAKKKRNETTPSFSVPPQKKKVTTKDVLGTSVDRMASSFEEFIHATTKNLAPKDVWKEIMAILDLSREEQIKACAWFIENDKQFLMLKEVPMEMKKDMALMFISNLSA
uniref:uncharacterized protein LOC105349462 n=1 Tax=Fragaria vesca subsp. vesca TaxID=101020 RepID=UPI0005C87335|nr:PREDICTED: uncharacterized protein LOC105349462 [Fragaria vesca subsp. vesca]